MVKDLTVLIVRILIRRRTIISKNGWSHAKHTLCNGKRVGGSNAFMKGNYDFIEGAMYFIRRYKRDVKSKCQKE